MKKHLFTLLILFVFIPTNILNAQCESEISTNPNNPVNEQFLPMMNQWFPSNGPYTVNSFLNTGIDWHIPKTIPIDVSSSWSHPLGPNTTIYNMKNPFSDIASSPSTSHLKTPSKEAMRDFRWEDGWELLWSNLGRFPNGDRVNLPGTGTFFGENGIPTEPDPSNIPYFVLYNRYRGTARLFSNVWYDVLNTNFNDLEVSMKYTDGSGIAENISGLFRHSGVYDQALDQPTQSLGHFTPRKHPTSLSTPDWQVSEFQMAFDPCICLKEYDGTKNPGVVEFSFKQIQSMTFDMISRTIEVPQEITTGNFQDRDFLNMSGIDGSNYIPGTRVYKKMDNLLSDYQEKLNMYYQDLADYNDPWNQAKWQLLDLGKNFISSSAALVIPTGVPEKVLKALSINAKIEDNQKTADKIVSDGMKGLIGIGYDYASFELFGKKPEMPVKPTVPVASFSETAYKGTITHNNETRTSPLLIPGGVTDASSNYGYGSGIGIYQQNFPAYNKVLGQVALLESPVAEFVNEAIMPEDELFGKRVPINNFWLKINDLNIALNRILNFDFEKTNSYANIEIHLKVTPQTHFAGSDYGPQVNQSLPSLYLFDSFQNAFSTLFSNLPSDKKVGFVYQNLGSFLVSRIFYDNESPVVVMNSSWVELKDLNQHVFSFSQDYDDIGNEIVYHDDDSITVIINSAAYLGSFEVLSIKIKLLHDMYFDQIGSFDEQINTTQIYTYLLYGEELGGVAKNVTELSSSESLNRYLVGKTVIENEHITPNHNLVFETDGNIIFINAEQVEISGELTVEDGYQLIVQSLYPINVLVGADIGKNITLRIKKDWFDLEPFTYMDNSEVYNFCNDNSRYRANELDPIPRKRLEEQIAERELQEMLNKERSPEIQLYPNPTSNTVMVSGLDENSNVLHIYDLKGMKVYSQDVRNLKSTSVDVSSLMSGIYLVVVERENGLVSQKRLNKL